MSGENSIRMKMLELEKRIVELEMQFSSLKEKIKELEKLNISDILNKIEELEDLFLIESASLSEIENLIETEITANLESKIEESKKMQEEKVSQFIRQINEVNEELKNTKNVLNRLNEKIEELTNSFSNLKEEISDKLSKFEEARKIVEEELNKRIPESLFSTLVKLENEISLIKVKIASLSEQVEKLFIDIQLLEPAAIRENVNKIKEVKEEISSKIQEISSFISLCNENREKLKELNSLKRRNEEISKQIEKLSLEAGDILSRIEELEKKLDEIYARNYVRMEDFSSCVLDLKRVLLEVEKIKKDILGYLTKDEFQSIKKEIEENKSNLEEIKSKLIPENLVQNILNRISFLEARIEKLEELSKEKVNPIVLE